MKVLVVALVRESSKTLSCQTRTQLLPSQMSLTKHTHLKQKMMMKVLVVALVRESSKILKILHI